jgi:hypothetical protein
VVKEHLRTSVLANHLNRTITPCQGRERWASGQIKYGHIFLCHAQTMALKL